MGAGPRTKEQHPDSKRPFIITLDTRGLTSENGRNYALIVKRNRRVWCSKLSALLAYMPSFQI